MLCGAYKGLILDVRKHADWKWRDEKRYSMQVEIKRSLGYHTYIRKSRP